MVAPLVGQKVFATHIDVAVARASVIESEAEKRARQLGFVEHEGRLVHRSELQRREVQREREDNYAEGTPTPEETEASMRQVEEEEEAEFLARLEAGLED
jgi:ribosomal protein L15E